MTIYALVMHFADGGSGILCYYLHESDARAHADRLAEPSRAVTRALLNLHPAHPATVRPIAVRDHCDAEVR